MAESTRRYNFRNTKKKPQGVLLKRWEVEYSKLISEENRHIPLEKGTAAIRSAFEDSGIEQWRITLKCPLSIQRIKVPARYADCTHIECFDLEAFLRMKTQKNLRVCPICQKEIEMPLANLRIDLYIENVLSALPDVMQVELMPDGSFTEVHAELDIELNVINDEEPYVLEVKQEALEDDEEYITLSDGEDELMEETSIIDMKPISLMPLNIDVKPNIIASSVSEQTNPGGCQVVQEIESPIPFVPSAVPTPIVKTEQIVIDPINNSSQSATPEAAIIPKREPLECDFTVPVALPLQAILSCIEPTNVDIKPNITSSLEPELTHSGSGQEIQDYYNMEMRVEQIMEEAQKIREMQVEIEKMKKREERRQKIHEWRFEKQFNTPSSSPFNSPAVLHALPLQEKMLLDSRSVYVGNVDYSATPDQLEEHFHGCGAIERVTIAKDKFSGHPKGFAYIQFTEADGMRNAISMTESLFLGRQIKVTEKRTNRPGISTTNRPPRRGKTQMIMKYILPGRGMMGGRPRRHGFSPY